MRRWLALLLVAGCGTTQWDKPGATQEVADADARACAAAAQTAPTLPRSQTTVTSSGAVITTDPAQPLDARRQMEQGERMQECMRQRGYTLKGT
ncbi:MAG TPA: hypothetical protein VNU64_11825 [Burkholderiales bacterium]|nr:hypothetical protein [Burkholderiales bacterium]